MCAHGIPLHLGLLHALRLEANPNSNASANWLTLNGLDKARAPVAALADLLAEGDHFARPGEPVLWPHEQAVLEALARIDREPDQAENLLDFLPPTTRTAGMALLADLSRCISTELVTRLRQPSPNPGNRPATS